MDTCTACKGPFHPATGHQPSPNQRWCGPCSKDFVKFLKQHSSRRWGGERFYDHATVPVGDTSERDLALDREHERNHLPTGSRS